MAAGGRARRLPRRWRPARRRRASTTLPPPSRRPMRRSNSTGRLSARHGETGVAAGFRWVHAPGSGRAPALDALRSGARPAFRRRHRASCSNCRTAASRARATGSRSPREALGVPVPVRGLAWWVRGAPHPASEHAVERDSAGRADRAAAGRMGDRLRLPGRAARGRRAWCSPIPASRSGWRWTRTPKWARGSNDRTHPTPMQQRTSRDTLVVPAPAKVNLFLHVTGRRDDGYHLLESLFALVDLADTVTLARRDDRRDRPRARRARASRHRPTSRCVPRSRCASDRRVVRRVDRRRQAHPDRRGTRRRQLRRRERAARAEPPLGARAFAAPSLPGSG